MKLVTLSSFIVLLFLAFSFSSCEKDTENSSKLDTYQDKPCELLTEDIIKRHITTTYEIKSKSEINQSAPIGAATCSYSWRKSEGNDSDYFINITMMDYEKNKFYFSTNNQEIVEGIGDSAYFRFVTPYSCTLFIRFADKIIILDVSTDDDDNQNNIDVAKKIAEEIL